MHKILFCVLLLFVSFVANAQEIERSIQHQEEQKAKSISKVNQARNFKLNLHYIDFHFEANPTEQYIKGFNRYHFISKENTSSLEFDLANNMQVDSVKYKNALMTYTHTDELLTIQLNSSLSAGQLDSIDTKARQSKQDLEHSAQGLMREHLYYGHSPSHMAINNGGLASRI
jgi:hypothetical protein